MKQTLILLATLLWTSPALAWEVELLNPEITVTHSKPWGIDIKVIIHPDDEAFSINGRFALDAAPQPGWLSDEPTCGGRFCWDVTEVLTKFTLPIDTSITIVGTTTFKPNIDTATLPSGIYKIMVIAEGIDASQAGYIMTINLVDEMPKSECNRKVHTHEDHFHVGKWAKGIRTTFPVRHRHRHWCAETEQ